MRNQIVIGTLLVGVLAFAYGMSLGEPLAHGAEAKNLRVYPKGIDKKVLKEDMKKITKALGVQCDFCHDMSAMEKDTNPHKDQARDMMRMTKAINKSLKKDGFKGTATCMTCHNGKEKPPQ